MGAGAGALSPGEEAEDQTWVLEAVSDAWLSPEWQTAVNEFYDRHCDQFAEFADGGSNSGGNSSGAGEAKWQGGTVECSFTHDQVFRKYQDLIEVRVKDLVVMYGCDPAKVVGVLEAQAMQDATSARGATMQSFLKRLATFESFSLFAKSMADHWKEVEHVRSLDGAQRSVDGGGGGGGGGRENIAENALNSRGPETASDPTLAYLKQRTDIDSISNHASSTTTTMPNKIRAPKIGLNVDATAPASLEEQMHQLLSEQERLAMDLKERQRRCVKLAKPMGLDREILKKLFEYVKSCIVDHNDTVQQHMAIIREILGSPGQTDGVDSVPTLANEMCALARAQAKEERTQQRIDELLPPGSPLASSMEAGGMEEDLRRAIEESEQMHKIHQMRQGGNAAGSGELRSPNQTVMKKAAISSAMDEAERRARREELERNYDKTLQEVILRSRLEAERHEADRLRKLMLDTAMAAQLSEKDHANQGLRSQLMALEARLAGMQAASDGVAQAKQQSEDELRQQLEQNEKARMDIQCEMQRIIEGSSTEKTKWESKLTEERTAREAALAAIGEKESKLATAEAEVAAATAQRVALMSDLGAAQKESAVFKRALQREALAAEEARNAHLELAETTERLKGEHQSALDAERQRVAELERNLAQKEKEHASKVQEAMTYAEQMEELQRLRAADAARVASHEAKAEQLTKDLQREAEERRKLEHGVEEAKAQVGVSTDALQAQHEEKLQEVQDLIRAKESQLALQLQEIDQARQHEIKAAALEKKLREEQAHREALEASLRAAEEGNTATAAEASARAEELLRLRKAVEDSRKDGQMASSEVASMTAQLERERQTHRAQLAAATAAVGAEHAAALAAQKEAGEQEAARIKYDLEAQLVAVRADAASKVSETSAAARDLEDKLTAELESVRAKEHEEREQRAALEQERAELRRRLREREEGMTGLEAGLAKEKSERERLLREREEENKRLGERVAQAQRERERVSREAALLREEKESALNLAEQKGAEQLRQAEQQRDQLKEHMMSQVQEQARAAAEHASRATDLADKLQKEEARRKTIEARLEQELREARLQSESKVGEVATRAKAEEERLAKELAATQQASEKERSALKAAIKAQEEAVARLEKERATAMAEAKTNERVLWQQQEKAQLLHASLEEAKAAKRAQEERAVGLSEALQAEEKKRWELESQLNAARAQGNAREAEVTAQITAASRAKEEALQEMISESRAQAKILQEELNDAVASERKEKEQIRLLLEEERAAAKVERQKVTDQLTAQVREEEQRRAELEVRLKKELEGVREKLTGEARKRQQSLEAQIRESQGKLDETKNALEAQLDDNRRELDKERAARSEVEASLAREEKKRAALKRHLKKKLKEQMLDFEEERRAMTAKYEAAMRKAEQAAAHQAKSTKELRETKMARDEMVSLATAQATDAAKGHMKSELEAQKAARRQLEEELAAMRTQLDLQRQQTKSARLETSALRERVDSRDEGGGRGGGLQLGLPRGMPSGGGGGPGRIQGVGGMTPRHEKTERIQIQHDVEREQHHERVRRERERQRALLRERLERKRGEEMRPHTSSLAPGRRSSDEGGERKVAGEAWGANTMVAGRMEGSGGRGKDQKNLYSSGDDARTVVVKSRRPIVDFCDSDDD